jgi:hypothetical protein
MTPSLSYGSDPSVVGMHPGRAPRPTPRAGNCSRARRRAVAHGLARNRLRSCALRRIEVGRQPGSAHCGKPIPYPMQVPPGTAVKRCPFTS